MTDRQRAEHILRHPVKQGQLYVSEEGYEILVQRVIALIRRVRAKEAQKAYRENHTHYSDY
jgi:hypothetical protein